MELIIDYDVLYDLEGSASIRDVANALIAIERIMNTSPMIIEKLFDEIEIRKFHTKITRLSHESPLLEKIQLSIELAVKKKIEYLIDGVAKRTKVDFVMEHKSIIASIIAAMIGYGLVAAASAYIAGGGPTIRAEHSIIINVTAEKIGTSPDELKKAISDVLKDEGIKKLAKDAIGFVAPARNNQAGLKVAEEYSFSAKALAETPTLAEYNKQEDVSDKVDKFKVKIDIRATDRDKGSRGWAVVVPELGDIRVPLKIGTMVNLNILSEHRYWIADILAIYETDKYGSRQLSDVHIKNLYEHVEE